MVYGHFLFYFIPLYHFFVLRGNIANLVGKCGQLVLLGLAPNTIEPLQNYYGGIKLDIKHNKRPHTLNGQIINSFLHVTQVYTTLVNF